MDESKKPTPHHGVKLKSISTATRVLEENLLCALSRPHARQKNKNPSIFF
jgi:hypothetical protein